MPLKNEQTVFASLILSDSTARSSLYRKYTIVEVASSLFGLLSAFLAVWGFTADVQLRGAFNSNIVGGMAVLAFIGLMVIAMGAGINKRFIAFAEALSQHQQ